MKSIKLFAFVLIAALAVVSCKQDAAKDEARESLGQADASTNANLSTTTNVNGQTATAKPAEPVPVGPLTSVEFAETSFDFGEVMEGEKVVHEYKFTNTGSEPLVISNAKGSCGCTVPSWPREPIPVGGEGSIKVQFDSKGKGKVGGQPQSKRVTITANTDPANSFLTIKGKVNKDENAVTPAAPAS